MAEKSKKPIKLFFSAGEPSGDIHGANLIRRLKEARPEVETVGYGGPNMKNAGCELHEDLTALAVMWFGRALLNFFKFRDLVKKAERCFEKEKPDAVVLIDYPGFNWWIAGAAKRHGIPVLYYCPPQIWAWASWRVKKMRRLVDQILCSLPFEVDWFRENGCNAVFIGHPFFDETARDRTDRAFIEGLRADGRPMVVILPGSRNQEVKHNLPWFLKAAEQVLKAVPEVRFAVAAFKEEHAQRARTRIAAMGLPIDVYVGRTPELMQAAHCCMACSGSVSLELLYYTKPTVILYSVSRLAYRVQKWFRRVKYITLVNLLSTNELFPGDLTPFDPSQPDAEEVLFPEYLTCEDKSGQIAAHTIEWLTDPGAYAKRVDQLRSLKTAVAHEGAAKHAAEAILAAAGANNEHLLDEGHVSLAALHGHETAARRCF